MDYKKAYEEALKRARKLYERGTITESLGHVFPELKENEDERIRKALIKGFQHYDKESKWGEFTTTEIISWLEKQGEQKPAEKVESEFKVGDWITNGEYLWQITNIDRLDCTLKSQNGDVVEDNINYVENEFHIWTIQDIKDGDVLSVEDGRAFIFKDFSDGKHPYCPVAYCGIDSMNEFEIGSGGWWTSDEIKPSTEEQRNLLFQKMKEAGYEWDAKNKELKKIEQKHSWSEEDEKILKRIDSLLYSQCTIYGSEYENIHNWLKSIKPNHWKPSEEQMEALLYALGRGGNYNHEALTKLYNNLKTL